MENEQLTNYHKSEIKRHKIMIVVLCLVFITTLINFGMLAFNSGNILQTQEILLEVQKVAEIVRMREEQ